ncbi:MAG: metallopeptidase TldD-related protein [Pseudomonadota bacterium]
MTDRIQENHDRLAKLLDDCLAAGADAVDARLGVSDGVSVDIREGKLESVERSESAGVSLRCFVGLRQAHVSGSDLSADGLAALSERCVAMAKAAPEDKYCGLAAAGELSLEDRDLDAAGDGEIASDILERTALQAEATALDVDGIKQVSDCSASWSSSESWVAASNGFARHRAGSASSLAVVCIAEQDGRMERSYEARRSRYVSDRPGPEDIGLKAAEKTLARLGARKVETQTAPVIYDREVAGSLVSALLGAISGPSIARGISFLKDRMGDAVFGADVTIVDDPFRRRGLASRLFDGEGRAVQETRLIDQGVLTQWLLNGPSARQLGLVPNGFSSFGFGDPPGVTTSNLYMEAGAESVESMMTRLGRGLLVTTMFGPSINSNTGDYSVGVGGNWFENGVLQHAVSEVTIAGNLIDMFARLVPADDLELIGTRDTPSILVEDMSIAGT